MTSASASQPSPRRLAPSAPEHVDRAGLRSLVGFNLRICYGVASQIFSRAFDDIDLAPIQFAALEFVAHNPDLSQAEIAGGIGTAPSVLVGPLEKLERRRLIHRSRDPMDRRRSVVRLTTTGEDVLADARVRIETVESQLTQELTEDERGKLLELLQRVATSGDALPG